MSNDDSNNYPLMASAMMDYLTTMKAVVDAVVGYRSDLLSNAFTLEQANVMAMEFHTVLIGILLNAQKSASEEEEVES
jgi:hypothetical protein